MLKTSRFSVVVWTHVLLLAGMPKPMFSQQNSLSGIRPIGMGNAFTAVVDDENALFFNAAGLNALSKGHTSVLLNAQAISDRTSFDIYKFLIEERETIENGLDGISVGDEEFIENLSEFSGKTATSVMRHRVFESVKTNIGYSLYSEVFTEYTIETAGLLDTTLDSSAQSGFLRIPVKTTVRSTFTLGYASRLPTGSENHVFAYGINFSYFTDHSLSESSTIEDAEDFRNYFVYGSPDILQIYDDSRLEHGLRINVGGLYRVRPYHTNLSVTIQNFINTSPAAQESRRYGIGLAHKPLGFTDIAFPKDLILAADLVDIFSDATSFEDKLHLGMELKLPLLSGRIGLWSGETTYGASLNLGFIHIHYAYAPLFIGPRDFQQTDNKHFIEFRIGS